MSLAAFPISLELLQKLNVALNKLVMDDCTCAVPEFGRRLSWKRSWSDAVQPVVLPPDPGPWHTAWLTGPWRPPSRWTWCRWTAARGSPLPGCSAAAWPRRLPVSFREEGEEEGDFERRWRTQRKQSLDESRCVQNIHQTPKEALNGIQIMQLFCCCKCNDNGLG